VVFWVVAQQHRKPRLVNKISYFRWKPSREETTWNIKSCKGQGY